MERMTPQEWRDRVGSHVEKRRKELRLSIRAAARAADVSESLWRQVETGVRPVRGGVVETANPRPGNRAAISRALGWDVESIDALERGDEPLLLEEAYELVRRYLAEEGAGEDQSRLTLQELDRMQTVPSRIERLDDEISSLRAELDAERAARRSEVQELRDTVEELTDQLGAIAAAVDDLRRGGGAASPRAATE